MNLDYYHLNVMVAARVATAIRLARLGEKDVARTWLYFVEQSQLAKILASHGFDVSHLCSDMVLLRQLVHPQETVQAASAKDLSAIMEKLSQLEQQIALGQVAAPAQSISVSGSGLPVSEHLKPDPRKIRVQNYNEKNCCN